MQLAIPKLTAKPNLTQHNQLGDEYLVYTSTQCLCIFEYGIAYIYLSRHPSVHPYTHACTPVQR